MSAAKKSSGGRSGASRSSGSRSKPTKKKTAKKTPKSGAKSTPKKTARKKTTAKKTAARRGSAGGKTAKKTTATKRKKTSARARKTSRPTTQSTQATQAGKAKRTSSRPAKLDSPSLARIRKQLEEERASLEAQMVELEEESFQGTQSELTGEVGIDEDFADAGSATFDREQALSIQNNIRDLIDQVDRALYRIKDGTYGLCERCGRPIDAARLKALPRTLQCTDCKRREERAR
jgi:RNA polymerase-binding protein DksA